MENGESMLIMVVVGRKGLSSVSQGVDYGSILKMIDLLGKNHTKTSQRLWTAAVHSTEDTKMNAKKDFFLKSFLLPRPLL